MIFMEFDQGGILRRETGLDTPKLVRLLIGNPLTMKEMAKHVPDAGSYVPVTVLVDERSDGVHVSYDRMVGVGGRGRFSLGRPIWLANAVSPDAS
jgi:uncharacterized protein (DUF302 family)